MSINILNQTVSLTNNKGFLTQSWTLAFDLTDSYSPELRALLGWGNVKSGLVESTPLLTGTSSDLDVKNYLVTIIDSLFGTSNTSAENIVLNYSDPEHYLLEVNLPSGSKPYYYGSTVDSESDVTWRLSYCNTAGDSSSINSTVLSGNSTYINGVSPTVQGGGISQERNGIIWYPVAQVVDGTLRPRLGNIIRIENAISNQLITSQESISEGLITVKELVNENLITKSELDNDGYIVYDLIYKYEVPIQQLQGLGYSIASTSGDPHIFPMMGNPYELPFSPGIYRMLQGDNLIVNASTRKINSNETSQINKYFKEKGASKSQIKRVVDDGCFYHKATVKCGKMGFTYNFDNKKVTFENKASAKYFTIQTSKSSNKNSYNKYEQCEEVAKVIINFSHESYGPMCLEFNYFSNPQIKYGVSFMAHDIENLSGLLIKEYDIQSMTIDNINDAQMLEGFVGVNNSNTELMII